MMQLSKRIPARTKTVKFRWCTKNFARMSDKYRRVRAKYCSKRSPMDSCFWCGYKFENGEMMALASPEKGTNKVLCQKCVDVLESGNILKEKEK